MIVGIKMLLIVWNFARVTPPYIFMVIIILIVNVTLILIQYNTIHTLGLSAQESASMVVYNIDKLLLNIFFSSLLGITDSIIHILIPLS